MAAHMNSVAIFESVEKITGQMLLAAQRQDWDTLAQLEADCKNYMLQLQAHPDQEPLSSQAQARKFASIKQILAYDREIRSLIHPWMDHIAGVTSAPVTRKARKHYIQ
jgi:flagellar protein FliT